MVDIPIGYSEVLDTDRDGNQEIPDFTNVQLISQLSFDSRTETVECVYGPEPSQS